VAVEAAGLAPPVEEAFHGAVRRAAARRGRRGPPAASRRSRVFLGAKGGSGTTTVSVNCAVELARLTKRPTIIVDLKTSLGEVALFLGVRPRFTVLDAIENLHRLDKDFLRELVARHKSGLDILAGSEQFDRPNAQDAGAVEEVMRVWAACTLHRGGRGQQHSCSAAARYAADTIFLVTNLTCPPPNAQRLLDRVRQLGAGGERIRVLLNRASDDHLIEPKQIESALGYSIHHTFSSDYRTVSMALNSGVPLALSNHSEIAAQFDSFTRHLVGAPTEGEKAPAERKRAFLGLL
jgi:pilus assembly protein CpaE